MNKTTLKDQFGWGILLWFIGYILGMILFFVMPPAMMGWVIMPIGIVITVWVLMKKIKPISLAYYLKIAAVWTLIAIIFDYLFIVRILKPSDGYYKPDVYLYYIFTFLLPVIVYWWKKRKK